MSDWHESDDFWRTFAPYMFTKERLEAAAAEVAALIELLALAPHSRVLDLCCGPGRHALEFSRRGHAVVGVDRTEAYLEQARKAATAEKLPIEFVHADARSFARPDAFDAALNLFTSFGYFDDADDDLAVARNLYSSLRPGGRAVVDINGKEILARKFSERDWRSLPDGALFLEERRLLGSWERVESRWIVIRPDGTRKEGKLNVRLYSATELAALLRRAGFSSVALYGSVAGIPYDHRAERLVAVAEK